MQLAAELKVTNAGSIAAWLFLDAFLLAVVVCPSSVREARGVSANSTSMYFVYFLGNSAKFVSATMHGFPVNL